MSREERLYIITYDIADQKRWRHIYKLLRGYGVWVQLSVFQLRLSRKRHQELMGRLQEMIHHNEDHVLCLDLGRAEKKKTQVISIGKSFSPITKEPVIV